MPSQTFALEHGGPKRLKISWKQGWKNLEVQLDGRSLLIVPTSKELKDGRQVQLDVGKVLRVQLNSTFVGGSKLLLSLNDRPLPGSAQDPHARLKSAVGIIYFVGALSIAIGTIAQLFSVESFQGAGFGWGTVVEGLIFLGLGLWVHKRHSLVGLALAVGLFSLDAIVGFIMVASQPGTPPNSGAAVVKIIFIIGMSRGFNAITELRREEKGVVSPPRTA